jgi:hypothetical protein
MAANHPVMRHLYSNLPLLFLPSLINLYHMSLTHMGNSKYAPDIQTAAYSEGKKTMLT